MSHWTPPALAALVEFGSRLEHLHFHGLSLHSCLVLHRSFADGAITHHLRAHLQSEEWCRRWDAVIAAWWQRVIDRPLTLEQSQQLFLPLPMGGCGEQSAEKRHLTAFLGSWKLCFRDVCRATGSNSAAHFTEECPAVVQSIEGAAAALREAGLVDYRFEPALHFGKSFARQQHALTTDLNTELAARLVAALPAADAVDFRSAGGTGAGAFLQLQTDPTHRLDDARLRVCLRARLRASHPAHDFAATTEPPTHCHHRTEQGAFCGELLDERGLHAATCPTGPALTAGHNAIRDWLARWLTRSCGIAADTEQFEPRWDRRKPDGTPEGKLVRARLDVVCTDRKGVRTFVDVVCTHAGGSGLLGMVELEARAQENGRAAHHAAVQKRVRYPPHTVPGVSLVPFALEGLGRLSDEARGFLRAMAPSAPILGCAYQELSYLVQRRLAEAVLSAAPGTCPRPVTDNA